MRPGDPYLRSLNGDGVASRVPLGDGHRDICTGTATGGTVTIPWNREPPSVALRGDEVDRTEWRTESQNRDLCLGPDRRDR